MNECHFIGNLTRDPELKTFDSGKKVAKFSIALNGKGKKDKTDATFIECEVWDKQAELISEYFTKGDPILVHCSLKQENWKDKESGQNRSKHKCLVNRFEFLPGGNKKKNKLAEGEIDTSSESVDVGQPANGDDIPF